MRLSVKLFGMFLICAAGLPGADPAAPVTRTDRLDFPSGGTLKMTNSSGELVVEGWDQPGIEIVTTKSVKPGSRGADFDKVKITAERKGNDVVIATVLPRHSKLLRLFEGETDYDLDYTIRLPRTARVEISHDMGEVHVQGVAGEIHAHVGMGLLSVQVPEAGEYSIDAKSQVGSVNSDFGGAEKRERLLGQTLSGGASAAAPQKLYLRIGYGDVMVLALRQPKTP